MKSIILILLLSISSSFAGLVKKSASFKITPEKIGRDIHYNATFYKKNVSEEVKKFDVEALAQKPNTLMVFFKSALIIDKPVDELDLNQFEERDIHAQILEAKIQEEYIDAPYSWRMSIRIAVKKIEFDYQAFLTSNITKDESVNSYIEASEKLDQNLPETEYYLVQYLDQYDEGVDKMITLSKIIPYGNKTLVVSYQLSRLYKKWYGRYNIFNTVKRIFTNKLTKTIEKTKDFLNK